MLLEAILPKSVERMVKSRMKLLQKQIDQITAMMIALKEKSSSINETIEIPTATEGVGRWGQ